MRAATTFILVMFTGAGLALLLDQLTLGFLSGFALGAAYLMAASIAINSRRQPA